MRVGIDIGSTTVKLVAIDDEERLVYKRYERHKSEVFQKVRELLRDFAKKCTERTHIEKADANKVYTEQTHMEKADENKAYTEQTHTEKPDADKAYTERTHIEKTDADKTHIERTPKEKLDANKVFTQQKYIEQKQIEQKHTEQMQTENVHIEITGSGGLSLAKRLGLPFEQEVIACTEAVRRRIPQTDVAIELGGEDAKITFYGENMEQRMNGTCAGGTGAFIDQMAVLLHTDASALNDMAKHYTTIYPIAARCGVFAKTDIQPLLNEGAKKDDLAVSIFQAVVDQTISGLACGREITGNVAFLGGPLYFLSELRHRFAETLRLREDQIIFPEDSQYYPAIGAAYLSGDQDAVNLQDILKKIDEPWQEETMKTMPALFDSRQEYESFKERHDRHQVKRASLKEAKGPVYLGIDAGSTTTKLTLIDEEESLLYSCYRSNEGNPVAVSREMMLELYAVLPKEAYISYALTTGYGEELVKSALRADGGEIETVAHYQGAKGFLPEVDFILDIGGQDMKCIRLEDGAVSSIVLNEACSSGCGSFLETYAESVGDSIEEFANLAIRSRHPVDLGTRCTVFMNSKVKQVQKEGSSLEDISAGLCYSVIRNALYKVLKLRNVDDIGAYPVVQGGTFLNDGVLAALEKLLGREVVRPDIAGLMGAYGAARLAKKAAGKRQSSILQSTISQSTISQSTISRSTILQSTILKEEELKQFSMKTMHRRCGGCQNHCQMTISRFGDGHSYITGNRCERGVGGDENKSVERNLFHYKYERLFAYTPLDEKNAPRGTIGIPRVLNMYENYPFWFTFFTNLGFRVVLSPPSSKKIYEMGMNTISSDTVCYPAKLVHGHIRWLAEQGIGTIFYPCISYEMKEDEAADNHFNCPVVGMYPEVIAGNMDEVLEQNHTRLVHPFLPYYDEEKMVERMWEELREYKIKKRKSFRLSINRQWKWA